MKWDRVAVKYIGKIFEIATARIIFHHPAYAHADFILEEGLDIKYDSKSEAYSPEALGGRRRVKFGGISLAGGMIKQRMGQLGLDYGEKEINEVRIRIKGIFMEQHRDISLGEFDALAKEVCAQKDS